MRPLGTFNSALANQCGTMGFRSNEPYMLNTSAHSDTWMAIASVPRFSKAHAAMWCASPRDINAGIGLKILRRLPFYLKIARIRTIQGAILSATSLPGRAAAGVTPGSPKSFPASNLR
jgi:hypothetical protein